RYKERFRAGRVAAGPIRRAKRVDATIRPPVVVIVLDYNRVSRAMSEDRRCAVPTEVEGCQELSRRTELHQVALGVVVPRVSAEQNSAVRSDGRRGRLIVKHAPRSRFVRPRINARMRANAAAARLAVERQDASADGAIVAAIIEMTTQ